METPLCIICGSNMSTPFIQITDRFGDESFQIVNCECGFKYLSPRPELNEISSYYEDGNYDPHRTYNKSFFEKVYGWVQKKALKWKFTHISKFVTSGSLLDIGGGSGEFCAYFKSKGWTTVLQDSSEKARKNANSADITAYGLLSDINNEKFNLITMWHSLEHIHNISDLFANIDRLINVDGTLVVAVPNANAPERFFLKENWAPWDAPRHLYHFSFCQIDRLLLKHGWKIQSSKTMVQDTPYNILLSLKSNSPLQLIFGGFILLYSLIKSAVFGVSSSSSFMLICKRI